MFNKDDIVVYGNTGVCRITEISEKNGALYYTLNPIYSECMIYAPVEGKVFMREVMTKDAAEQLIEKIPDVKAEAYYNNRIQELSSHYKQILDSHDSLKLVEMIKSLYEKKSAAQKLNRKLGQVDERFMRQAEELLHGELAVALGIDRSNVIERIRACIAMAAAEV